MTCMTHYWYTHHHERFGTAVAVCMILSFVGQVAVLEWSVDLNNSMDTCDVVMNSVHKVYSTPVIVLTQNETL